MIAGAAFAASDYLEQFQPGDPIYDLAAEIEAQGCMGSEQHALDFLMARDAGISGAQAIIIDLANTGDIIWDGDSRYTLKDWGACE